MANCSNCFRYIANRDKKYYRVKNDPQTLLCDNCYHEMRSQKIKSNTIVSSENVEVRGVQIHNKVPTPEEIKKMFEKGPPGVDDKEPHVIDHDDEEKGYLWVDGKKVKKDNPDELK